MKYRINKGFIIQKLGKSTIIFDEKKSILYTFNQTASEIFKALKKGVEKKKIIETMTKRYSTEEKKIETDLNRLIADLLKKRIISSAKARSKSVVPTD